MNEVMRAYGRALKSLVTPGIFWHLLWPALLSIVLWCGAAWMSWDWLGARIEQWFAEVGWLNWIFQHWAASALVGSFFVKFVLILLLIPLIYGTTLLIVALFALPLMLDRVAARDYPELERRDGGTLAGSLGNALVAITVFLVGWVVTLPLWLIPGMAILLPVLLAGYLNYRGYSYDALSVHAGRDELPAVIARERSGLYLTGLLAGLLVFVPIVNLFIPACAGLAFIHYGLEALRRSRAGSRT